MLLFKDVPVVIEPGVGALEVALCRKTRAKARVFYVQFGRLNVTETVAEQLPFVMSSAAPHVFSMSDDIAQNPFLLVYDHLGKLRHVYMRDDVTGNWIANNLFQEHVGETVTQFSVRLTFDCVAQRDTFLHAINHLANKYRQNKRINWADQALRDSVNAMVKTIVSGNAPIVLPIAVDKLCFTYRDR
jgi:hypothetical protein